MSERNTSDTEKLAELLATVRSATGPDREIDAALYVLEIPRMAEILPHWSVIQKDDLLTRYTDSIDASIDLAERLLGRTVMWSVCIMEEGPYAQILRPMPDGGYVGGLTASHGNSAPLAILAAVLAAVLAARSSIKEVGK